MIKVFLPHGVFTDPTTGQPSANYQESFTVDALGETLTSTDQNSHTTNYAYNVLGQQVTVTDPLTRATNYTFDARGNLSSVTDALSHTTSYAYDGLGRQTSVTDPLGHATSTVYDARDNVLSVTDANNNTTSYTYDALNRETSMTDALSHVTNWAYNVGGTTDTMTDADNNTTSFVYDSFGRLSQQTDPLGHGSTYLYDRDGNLASSTDRDNRTINYTYDNLNRETGETWLASGGGTDNTLSYTYDAANNPLTAANSAGTYTMAYDAQNRTKNVTEPNGVSLTFGYDAVGNRTSVSDSLSGAESSNYDAANELTSRSLTVGSTQIHEEEAYFTDGSLQEQRSYGAGAPAAEVALEDYTYYADGRLSTLVAKDSAGGSTPTNTVMNYSYVNDPGGRLSSKTENGTTTSYGYDNTNQLTTVNGSTVASYDPTGNRTNTGYVTTTGNQLSTDGTWTYSYDGEGNNTYKVTSAGENWTYTYDERNHLIKAEHRLTVGGTVDISATYVYDAFGNRIEKDVTISGTTTVTRFVLDGWNPAKGPAIGNENWDVLADISSTGSLTSRYLRGDGVDQVFARIDKSGTTLTPYWYLTDNQGSIRMVIDNSGNAQASVSYDAFGNMTIDTAPAIHGRYGYVGLQFDPETGLLYARGREENLAIARWLSQDPIGFRAGDPNLYRVVGNEPTDATDPSGLSYINSTQVPNSDNQQLFYHHTLWAYTAFSLGLGALASREPDTWIGEYNPNTGLVRRGVAGQNHFAPYQAVVNAAEGRLGGMPDWNQFFLDNSQETNPRLQNAVQQSRAMLGQDFVNVGATASRLTQNLGEDVCAAAATQVLFLRLQGFHGSQGPNPYHALDRAIERGVRPQAILRTLRNPSVIVSQAGGRTLYLTTEAAVVLNAKGQAVTIWGGAQHNAATLALLRAAGVIP